MMTHDMTPHTTQDTRHDARSYTITSYYERGTKSTWSWFENLSLLKYVYYCCSPAAAAASYHTAAKQPDFHTKSNHIKEILPQPIEPDPARLRIISRLTLLLQFRMNHGKHPSSRRGMAYISAPSPVSSKQKPVRGIWSF